MYLKFDRRCNVGFRRKATWKRRNRPIGRSGRGNAFMNYTTVCRHDRAWYIVFLPAMFGLRFSTRSRPRLFFFALESGNRKVSLLRSVWFHDKSLRVRVWKNVDIPNPIFDPHTYRSIHGVYVDSSARLPYRRRNWKHPSFLTPFCTWRSNSVWFRPGCAPWLRWIADNPAGWSNHGNWIYKGGALSMLKNI